APVAKEPGARRAQLTAYQPHQPGIEHHLPLRLVALAAIREADKAVDEFDVCLAKGRDAERAVFFGVPLRSDPSEGLADETQHRSRYGVDVQIGRSTRGSRTPVQRATNPGKLLGQLPHPMVFAKVALHDGPIVVDVLLSSTRVVAPGLNGRPCAAC